LLREGHAGEEVSILGFTLLERLLPHGLNGNCWLHLILLDPESMKDAGQAAMARLGGDDAGAVLAAMRLLCLIAHLNSTRLLTPMSVFSSFNRSKCCRSCHVTVTGSEYGHSGLL
jgi:hypothetical protein